MTSTPLDPTESWTPNEAHAKAKAGEAVMVDIRRPDEWLSTGVPEGAHLLEMADPDFLNKINDLVGGDKSRPIALFCRTATRTRTVQAALRQMGYTHVVNVEGGLIGNPADPGWQRRGLPLHPSG
jgi:rhodanese-related sulfurtransferase